MSTEQHDFLTATPRNQADHIGSYKFFGNSCYFDVDCAEFLRIVAEGTNPGEYADLGVLTAWIEQFGNDFPTAVDETGAFQRAVLQPGGFPMSLAVGTATMEVTAVIAGQPHESFWAELEQQLAPDP